VSVTLWFDSAAERDATEKLIKDKLGALAALYTFKDLYRP